MAKLMGQKVHIILSYPDENQPPSGFPLIPVINIASSSALHQALISEFDLSNTASNQEVIELINKVANGEKVRQRYQVLVRLLPPER